MRNHSLAVSGLLVGILAVPHMAQAYEGNWKRGHVYFRMVCTECHAEQPSGKIGPNVKKRAEWSAYLEADRHANGSDSLKYYVSHAYRDSIKETNRAAAKYLDIPDDELYADVRAFVMRGAKDGDAPTGCR